MRLLLNIIWLVFAGVWLAILYTFAALICFVLIITILGLANFKLIPVSLLPLGRQIVPVDEARARGLAADAWLP